VTLGGVALSAAAVTWATGSWLQARASAAGLRRIVITVGAALIGTGIAISAGVLLPGAPVLVAVAGWAVAGLGMGLAYSMLTLYVLETSAAGEEGFSSSALQLTFTLGTAFGAGVGGAIVALAEGGLFPLAAAIAGVDAVMLTAALAATAVSLRVPRSRDGPRRVDSLAAAYPLEHS
jgi:MFS family permease